MEQFEKATTLPQHHILWVHRDHRYRTVFPECLAIDALHFNRHFIQILESGFALVVAVSGLNTILLTKIRYGSPETGKSP